MKMSRLFQKQVEHNNSFLLSSSMRLDFVFTIRKSTLVFSMTEEGYDDNQFKENINFQRILL